MGLQDSMRSGKRRGGHAWGDGDGWMVMIVIVMMDGDVEDVLSPSWPLVHQLVLPLKSVIFGRKQKGITYKLHADARTFWAGQPNRCGVGETQEDQSPHCFLANKNGLCVPGTVFFDPMIVVFFEYLHLETQNRQKGNKQIFKNSDLTSIDCMVSASSISHGIMLGVFVHDCNETISTSDRM